VDKKLNGKNMGAKKRATNKQQSALKTSKNNTQKLKKPLIKRFCSFIYCLFALVATFATIWIVVNPRVYVYPSINLDSANPVFTPFIVRNEGYLAIRDVKFYSSMKEIKLASGGPTVIAMVPFDNSFSDPKQVSRIIAPGEEASELLPFSNMEHNNFENADIAVRLSFRPFKLWPFSLYIRKELHRFELRTAKDGQRYWFPQPINK
jgi:hypothetical protein